MRGNYTTAPCAHCGVIVERLTSQCRSTIFCSKQCSSDARQGKPFKHSGQFHKGDAPWNAGLTKATEPGLQRASDSKRGDLNPMRRDDVAERASLSHLGVPLALDTRRHMSESQKARVAAGLSNVYIDGRSYDNPDRRNTIEYKLWRSQVFARDNWTCQHCFSSSHDLEAHHINAWATHPDARFDVANGMTLCKACHALTPNYRAKALQPQPLAA